MNMFRILVADHHPIFRFGLCSLLGAHEDWEVCGEASDGRDAIEKSKQLKPDLVILDICMPKLNGVDAARRILKENPEQQIMVLTDVDSEDVVRDCLEMGVRGWVFKSDRMDDLTIAVESMRQRKASFSMRVADLIMEGYLERQRVGPDAPKVPKLSPREREVVQLVGEGKNFQGSRHHPERDRQDGGDTSQQHHVQAQASFNRRVGAVRGEERNRPREASRSAALPESSSCPDVAPQGL